MQTLTQIVEALWGKKRAKAVTDEYKMAFDGRHLLVRDLAMFCNAAAPIGGGAEFDRGVEEGKRRVWLHITRMCGIRPEDFVTIADGKGDFE